MLIVFNSEVVQGDDSDYALPVSVSVLLDAMRRLATLPFGSSCI